MLHPQQTHDEKMTADTLSQAFAKSLSVRDNLQRENKRLADENAALRLELASLRAEARRYLDDSCRLADSLAHVAGRLSGELGVRIVHDAMRGLAPLRQTWQSIPTTPPVAQPVKANGEIVTPPPIPSGPLDEIGKCPRPE